MKNKTIFKLYFSQPVFGRLLVFAENLPFCTTQKISKKNPPPHSTSCQWLPGSCLWNTDDIYCGRGGGERERERERAREREREREEKGEDEDRAETRGAAARYTPNTHTLNGRRRGGRGGALR